MNCSRCGCTFFPGSSGHVLQVVVPSVGERAAEQEVAGGGVAVKQRRAGVPGVPATAGQTLV